MKAKLVSLLWLRKAVGCALVALAAGRPQAASASDLSGALLQVVNIPSDAWRASPPVPSRMKPHTGKPTRLTIHYTGMKQNPLKNIRDKVKGLFSFSTKVIEAPMKKVLWGDIPYHFYIDVKGDVAETRSTRYQPDTNTSYNPDGHITVVVEAGAGDPLSDNQKGKLFALMRSLQLQFSIPDSHVSTHKHYASTSCPGPAVEAAVGEYLQWRASSRKR